MDLWRPLVLLTRAGGVGGRRQVLAGPERGLEESVGAEGQWAACAKAKGQEEAGQQETTAPCPNKDAGLWHLSLPPSSA